MVRVIAVGRYVNGKVIFTKTLTGRDTHEKR